MTCKQRFSSPEHAGPLGIRQRKPFQKCSLKPFAQISIISWLTNSKVSSTKVLSLYFGSNQSTSMSTLNKKVPRGLNSSKY